MVNQYPLPPARTPTALIRVLLVLILYQNNQNHRWLLMPEFEGLNRSLGCEPLGVCD